MPSLVKDPNNLTKDKLKTELQKFNIPLPSSDSRKEVYVELYRDKILMADRLGFSSDDEAFSLTPTRNKKKQITPKRSSSKKLSKKPSSEEDDMDVDSLTDAQLAAKLKDMGVDVGPIIDSTRKVYRRKLQRLIDEEGVKTNNIFSNNTQILEQEFSDNDETEVKEVYQSVQESYKVATKKESYKAPAVDSYKAPTKKESRKAPTKVQSFTETSYTSPTLETYRRRTLRDGDSPIDIPKLSSRTPKTLIKSFLTDEVDSGFSNSRPVEENHFTARATRSRAADIVSQAKPEPEQKKAKKGISIWVQLIIIAVVAVIIFLIIQNMEPANKSPIGKLENGP